VAMREYYLAGFLNQVLPGGVVGDVNRAWRHARAPVGEPLSGKATRAIVHAVMLERLSGQLVLLPVAVLAMAVPVTISGWGVREGGVENRLPCDVGVQCVPDHGLPACIFVVISV